VTSQKSPQLLVSNKFVLADSIGSDLLTSIEQLFACIAEVVEGLTAAFECRPDGAVRKFAKTLGFCLPFPPRTRLLLPGFDACLLRAAAVCHNYNMTIARQARASLRQMSIVTRHARL
jgi:hypothetical protein